VLTVGHREVLPVDMRQLEYFLAVVDYGGVGKAAEALHIAQPSLSQTLGRLERRLGTPLFHRAGRGLVLTSAGEALIGPARQILRDVGRAEDLVRGVRDLETGRVDICAIPSLAVEPLSPWIGIFRARHPRVGVRVDEPSTASGVADLVHSGNSELGFTTASSFRQELASVELSQQHLVAVLPQGMDAKTTGRTISLESLARKPLITHRRGTDSWMHIAEVLDSRGIELGPTVDVASPSAVMNLVVNGAGAALLPLRLAVEASRRGAQIFDLDPPVADPINVVHRREKLSAPAKAFLELVIADARRWTTALSASRSTGLSFTEAALQLDGVISMARARTHSAVATSSLAPLCPST
jgi:LysR family transcriptional regulator, nitrogen assimilation regulatory protein